MGREKKKKEEENSDYRFSEQEHIFQPVLPYL